MSPATSRPSVSFACNRPPVIATVLTPLERVRVDVASEGVFEVLHRGTVEELSEDVREHEVDAVIISVARYDTGSTARMAAMVREFPTVPTFALLTDVQRSTPHSVLELGRVGVRTLIDARSPAGWSALRDLLTHERSTDVQCQMLGALNLDLGSHQLILGFHRGVLTRRHRERSRDETGESGEDDRVTYSTASAHARNERDIRDKAVHRTEDCRAQSPSGHVTVMRLWVMRLLF